MATERGRVSSKDVPLSSVILGEEDRQVLMDAELAEALMADVAGLSTQWDEESQDVYGVTIDSGGMPIRVPEGLFGEDETQNRSLERELGKAHTRNLEEAWEEKRRQDIKAGKRYEQ